MAYQIDYVQSWADRLEGRLYEQFKGKAKIVSLVRSVIAPQAQEIEDAAQALLTIASIDDSYGAQLDNLGRLVGQPRSGVDDATYRLYLRARIRANLSDGDPESMYKVFSALFGVGSSLIYVPGHDAAFEMRQNAPVLTPTQALVAQGFLFDSKVAGTRGIYEWQESADASMLTTAVGSPLMSNVSAGDDALFLDTRLIPASGQLILDYGLSTQETVTYVYDNPIRVELSAAMAFDHSVGSMAELVGERGAGLGDTANPATGGALEGAIDVG